MGVSLNGGTPKWMVYDGKPQLGWFGGTTIVGNTHIIQPIPTSFICSQVVAPPDAKVLMQTMGG